MAGLRAWRVGLFALPIQVCYFALFYLELRTGEDFPVWRLLLLVFALWLYLAYIVLVNDYADREVDALAGKGTVARGHALRPSGVRAVLLAMVLGNAAAVFLLGGGAAFDLVWVVAYALGTLYSLPPAALKRRGLWGFLSDSLIEKPLPVLVVFTFFRYYGYEAVLFPVMAEALDSVFKHQERDFEIDVASGMRTFAVSIGKPLSTRLVDRLIHPADVLLVAAAFAVASLLLPAVSALVLVELGLTALGFALVALRFGRRVFRARELGWVDPPYVTYFNACFIVVLTSTLAFAAAASMAFVPLVILFLVSLVPYLLYYARLGAKLLPGKAQREAGPSRPPGGAAGRISTRGLNAAPKSWTISFPSPSLNS